MTSATEIRRLFKSRLTAPEVIAAPGCSDPITVRLVESLGFGAVHVSGSVAHRTSGYADAGVLTMTEMVDRISAMANVTEIPLITDADTGFGSAVNVVRTVKEYERAGASAIHIEDQLTPKRPTYQGFEGGFISRAEMVDKIRAAVDARSDEGLLIVARCDIPDQPEKMERVLACLEAGADIAWMQGRDPDQIRDFCSTVKKPTMGVLPRNMTLGEYQAAGGTCALLPGVLQIAALCAQRAMLEELRKTGTVETFLDAQPFSKEMRGYYNNQGNDELQRIEREYGGASAAPV